MLARLGAAGPLDALYLALHGAMMAEDAPFRIDDILQALALEFGPAARKRGLKFKVMPCGLTVPAIHCVSPSRSSRKWWR